MGIIFSNSIDNDDDPVKSPSGAGTDGALFEKNITSRSSLRVESHVVQKLAETYSNHYYLPIAGRAELWSLVSTALGSSFPDTKLLFATVWEMFSREGLCRTQEVLVCLALVSDGSWRTRLSIIFDIFKSTCTNEIFAEDIMLGLEVVMQACLTLWTTDLSVVTNRDEVHALAEEIAIAALDKLGKKPDDGVVREDFLLWATERFKESKTIANEDALLRVYRFQ